jgi:hypothetical protein
MAHRILVIGRAKTGTTVISKSIQNSISGAQYALEPKRIGFFDNDRWRKDARPWVVKMIFEHWNVAPRLRSAIINNECLLKFDRIVAIQRDPRDELISRMFYVILPYLQKNGYQGEKVEAWLEVLRRKECEPDTLGVVEMLRELKRILGMDLLSQRAFQSTGNYQRFLETNGAMLHTLHYEDFMERRFVGLEEYIGCPLKCVDTVEDLDRTRRSGTYNNWKRLFTEDDVTHLKPLWDDNLKRMGYSDWELNIDRLDPAQGSEYVVSLVREYERLGERRWLGAFNRQGSS